MRRAHDEALQEVLSRRITGARALKKELLDSKFSHQKNFVMDAAKLKAAFCTRRGAKSYSGGLHIFKDLSETTAANGLYLALTRESARSIVWKDVLKDINKKQTLGARFNESRLTMTLPNESICYVAGADSNEEEMEKLLGRKYKIVVIDEGQSWHVDMRRLVYGILKPAVADYRGTICLLGTAGNLTQGLFYDITRKDGEPREPGWSVHEWTANENPYIKEQWQEEIEEIRRTRPLFLQTALYKQWYLNEWVIDTNKLVYWYKEGRNDFQSLPRLPQAGWSYVLGVDLGYSPDPSAFALVAFHENDRTLYGLEVFKQTEMDVTDVANKIKEYQERYPIFKVVIDGSNKQAVEEMQKRHGIALTAADKRGKADFISIMDAEFVQEQIKVLPGSCEPLTSEWKKLIWKTIGDKIVIPRQEHDGLANHCADAFLYAWRYCYQFLSAPAKPKVNLRDQKQYIEHAQKLMEQQLEREIEAQQAQENQEDVFALYEAEDQTDIFRHHLNKRKR